MPASRLPVGPTLSGRLRLLCLAGLLALGSSQAGAEPSRPERGAPAERSIVVVNRSQRSINQIYVSPSNADEWGEDRLGDDTVEPGGSFRVLLGSTRDCSFDVQVVYGDASQEEQVGIDLCHAGQTSFDGSTAKPAPDLFAQDHQVTLVNHAGRPIQQVYISSSSTDQWGDDRLGEHSVSVDDARTVTYRGACAADLRVVFDNRSAEERHGLDLCATPKLLIRPGWTTEDAPPVP